MKMERRIGPVLCLLLLLLLAPPKLFAQDNLVKGVVVDNTGEPIIGASILEKGTTNGTITDLDGNFQLKVSKTSNKLVISYVGMKTLEVTPTPGKEMKIELADDTQVMEEVVVIGYGGSKARKDLTGSVGSVSGAKLAAVPVASAAEALQGKIAGVQVTTVDGAPGADINIRVRGGTSVTQSNQPLYIVDGFQQDNINDIPPTDIKSIDVLKDASLTAIYGAKGGNGVVVVTTKSAQQGKVKVEFNAYAQARKLAGKIDVLDTYEFARYQLDYTVGNNTKRYQFREDWGNPADLDIYKSGVTHDWQDEIMGGTPISQMYNVTVNGGTEKLRFSTSLTHHDERGVITNTGVRRTNMNTKINIQLSPKLKLLINPRFTYRRDLGAGGDGVGKEGIVGVLRYRPSNGLREYTYRDDKTLNYSEEKYWMLASPLEEINQNYQLKHGYTFTNQASLEWEILKNLTFRTDFGLSWSFSDLGRFYGYLTEQAMKQKDLPYAEITNERKNKYVWTNTLSYSFSMQDKHNWSFLLGHEMQDSQKTTNFQSARYFPQQTEPRVAFANMGLGTAWKNTSTITTPDRMLSFFGQANYNYDHKYLASVTFRADGSTKFAPGNQWGYFPSVSAAWVISKEPWWNVSFINNLKLRAAFGLAGNNNIDDDLWRYQYTIESTGGPSWNEATENGEAYYTSGTSFPNTKIKWETTITRNLALDLSFFNDRLSITPEFYWNTTRDLLYSCLIPTTTGYSKQMQNVGQVTNKGFELTVNGTIIQKRDFNLSASFTLGLNKTKVDKLNGEDTELWTTSSRWKSTDNDFCLRVGDEVGLIYGYVYDGIYQFDEFHRLGFNYEPNEGTLNCDDMYGTYPGRPKFKDLSGPDGKPDGKIDEYDRTIIGNTNPRFQGGFGISGQWKNFDFTANFVYMLDYDVLNATAYNLSSAIDSKQTDPKNVLADFNYDNRWVYYGDIYATNADGTPYVTNMNEMLLGNSQFIQYLDVYESLNGNKTLWNPNDVTKRVTHSYFVEDASFLRLQDVTIGYTLPEKWTSKWGIERLRVYFTGSNLFCWTSYSGYDPEVDIQSGLTPSVDYNRYPRSHGYLVGLNVSF